MKANLRIEMTISIEGDNWQELQNRRTMISRRMQAMASHEGEERPRLSVRLQDVQEDDGSVPLPQSFQCYDTPEGEKADAHLRQICKRMREKAKNARSRSHLSDIIGNAYVEWLKMDETFEGRKAGHRDTEPRNVLLDFANRIAQDYGLTPFETESFVSEACSQAEVEHRQQQVS